MALKNKVSILILLYSLLGFSVSAKIILPEFLTKQAVNNIRFLSKDGKFTYYQKRSGSFLFSSNYKVVEVIKGDMGTEYNVYATPARKKLLVTQNSNFQNILSFRLNQKIFLLNFGETSIKEIGYGISPHLLLNDSWLSYYDANNKTLSFENTTNAALKFSIKLNNRINPYFVPQVIMTDDNTIYYTDLSEEGNPGLLEFKRNTSKSEIIYKANTPMIHAEICQIGESLALGLFGIHGTKNGTTISKINLPFKDFTKREAIYSSGLNDLGRLVCDFDNENISFIKNTGTSINPIFDVVDLNIKSKKISVLSDLKSISNLFNMDGTLLTQEKGKYFIVKGDFDFKSQDTLKTRIEPPPSLKEIETSKEDELEDE